MQRDHGHPGLGIHTFTVASIDMYWLLATTDWASMSL